MTHSIEQQVIAIAGCFQASLLVDQIAKTGQIKEQDMIPSLQSLFIMNPKTTEEIFQNKEQLTLGIQTAINCLQKSTSNQCKQCIKYMLGLIYLEKKLTKHPTMLTNIHNRLQHTKKLVDHIGITHQNTISALADIYLNTISTFNKRIQIIGFQSHLKIESNSERIRALLLAGIRATILWRQLGGKRRHFIFQRRQLISALTNLIW